MTHIENPLSPQAPLAALVASYHGLDSESRRILVNTLDAALSPLIQTLDVAKAFKVADSHIYRRATDEMIAIAEGRTKCPTTTPLPLKCAARKSYRRFVPDEASIRIAKDVIVCALMSLVSDKDVARAVKYDDWLIIEVSSRILWRLRDAEKAAKKAQKVARHG